MASLKGNIILNALNTITGIIFPIVTFPYAARVLEPEGIGEVNFLNSIIGYILLITSLGIPMYGVKEIAKYRNDKEARDRIAIELLILSLILCVLGYAVVWALAKFVPQIHEEAPVFYVLSLSILFTAIGVNWFYQGIEDFKFITVRGIIIRVISAVCLFIFVKNKTDLLAYGAILVSSFVGNYIINFFHLKNHISFSSISIKTIDVLRHIKPTLQVFLLNVISSLYLQLNSVMLGFMSDDTEVGYFTAGTKITHIVILLITSATTVLIPRASNLIKEGNKEGFSKIINQTITLTSLFAYPITIGLMILASPITLIFCGPEFYGSIPVLLLNAPLILVISYTSIMAHQTLYPMEKIKIVIYSVSGGAITNIIFNILLIPYYGATGAAFSTLLTEVVVFLILLFFGKKYYPFKRNKFLSIKYLTGSIIMGVFIWFSLFLPVTLWIKLCIGVIVGILVYFVFLLAIHDNIIQIIKKKTLILDS